MAADSTRVVLGFRVASFLIGVAVIVDAVVQHASVVQWVAGLILVGIVPPEAVVAQLHRGRR
jgi:hypothetical protein